VILGIFSKVAKNSKPLQNDLGEFVLRYSPVIKWSCMGLIIFASLGLTFLLLKNPITDDGDFIAVISMFVALALFGLYFYIEFFTVKILVSENGIRGTSGWRGKREYSWSDIDEITYSAMSMWFKVSAKDKAPLRIHAYISGIDTFQKYYTENMPEKKWSKAHEVFSQDKRVSG
jgi:hypothetical protein